MSFKCISVLILVIVADLIDSKDPFSYHPKSPLGPSRWPGKCNIGAAQSPIAYDKVIGIPTPNNDNPLRMIGSFGTLPSKIQIYNDGHGPVYKLDYKDGTVPQITGGPLGNDIFSFVQFHFHWPCEHNPDKFKGRCDLETHFVHYNTKYASFADAVDKPDGLAAVGVMYTKKKFASSPKYMELVPRVMARNGDWYETVNLFSYADAMGFSFFPRYVSYKGSLTTPECCK